MIKQCPTCILKFNTDTSPYCPICVSDKVRRKLNKKFPPKYLTTSDKKIAKFRAEEIRTARKSINHSKDNFTCSHIEKDNH